MRERPMTRRLPITRRSVIPLTPSCIKTRVFKAMRRWWAKPASRKKAAPRPTLEARKAAQPGVGAYPGESGTCAGGREAGADRERRVAHHQSEVLGFGNGGGMWFTQPPGPGTQTSLTNMTRPYFG